LFVESFVVAVNGISLSGDDGDVDPLENNRVQSIMVDRIKVAENEVELG
jgi:hypothetical protein